MNSAIKKSHISICVIHAAWFANFSNAYICVVLVFCAEISFHLLVVNLLKILLTIYFGVMSDLQKCCRDGERLRML